jgi:soluble lytic murein transglycosylase
LRRIEQVRADFSLNMNFSESTPMPAISGAPKPITTLRHYNSAPLGWGIYPLALFLVALLLTACGDDPEPTPMPATASAVVAVPTFTPTPSHLAVASAATTVDAPGENRSAAPESKPGVVLPTDTPTATATDTPTSAPTPDPDGQLAQAAHLHRYGYYTDEQWLLLGLLADAATDESHGLTARYRLAESYLAEDNFALALDSLDKFNAEAAALAADAPQQINAVFLRGEVLAGLNRMGEASAAYQTFLANHPDLTSVVQEIIGDGWQRAGDVDQTTAAFRLAADATVDRVERVRILEKLAGQLESAGRWADAGAVLEEMLAQSVNPSYRVGLMQRAGAAQALAGNEASAIAHWQATLNEMPDSTAAYLALIELVNRNQPVDNLLRGQIDIYAEAWQPAITAYQEFLAQAAGDDSRRGDAWLGIGQAQMGLGLWNDALATFDRVITEFPACACFGQAWLGKGRLEILRGDPVTGRRIYRTFAREHPADPLAPEALWRSALSAIAADNAEEAAVDILALADGFPGSERAADGLSVLGINAFIDGRFSMAQDAFQRLRTNYPTVRPEASAYWLGRALYAQGQRDQARQIWLNLPAEEPGSYYDVLSKLAARRVDREPGDFIFGGIEQAAGPATTLAGDDSSRAFAEQWLAGWAAAPSAGWGILPAAVAGDVDLRNGQLLLDLGRRGEALAQLELVYRRYRDDPAAIYALALHFEELETFRLSIISAVWLIEHSPAKQMEDAPIFLQRMAYPRHFAELIDVEAGKNGFDPLIFYSLIRQESLFEEGARSYAAAQGLAQIIPATGEEIAGRLGFPNYSNALIYRPYINLRFGAFYLAWVRDFVDGRVTSALAGYNAGPGNSKRWRELSGPDDTLFVELMDYSEPRLYVQRILSHYYHYTRLYPE